MLLRETLLLRLLGLTKIPFLLAIRPRVLKLDEEGCVVVVPLSYFTSNHVGSMYFGALAAGADCAGGLNAARVIYGVRTTAHRGVVPIFKSLHAEFLKLADGDVTFRCDQGREIEDAVRQADRTGERVTLPVRVVASTARHDVARFELALSLKRKANR